MATKTKTSLQDRLRILRAKNKWTQADVAREIGVSQAWLSRFESGADVGEDVLSKIKVLVSRK